MSEYFFFTNNLIKYGLSTGEIYKNNDGYLMWNGRQIINTITQKVAHISDYDPKPFKDFTITKEVNK